MSMARMVKMLLDLGRVANLPTVWTNCMVAWWLAGGAYPDLGWPLWRATGALLMGTSLMYMAGTTLNDAFDHDFDREYRPERPLPMGMLTLRTVWVLGVTQLVLGALLLTIVAGASLLAVALLTGLIIAYNAIHKEWSGSVGIMGLCRVMLYIIPATLPGRELNSAVLLWAGALFVYIVAVSISARAESIPDGKHAGWTLILFLLPIALWLWGAHDLPARHWYVVLFPCIFFYVVHRASQLMRRDPPLNIGVGVAHLLAGICLLDAVAISVSQPLIAFLPAAAFPLTRFLQRYFAST